MAPPLLAGLAQPSSENSRLLSGSHQGSKCGRPPKSAGARGARGARPGARRAPAAARWLGSSIPATTVIHTTTTPRVNPAIRALPGRGCHWSKLPFEIPEDFFRAPSTPPARFLGPAPHHHTRWCGRRCWATIGCIISYSARSILLECVGLGTANAEARSHQMRQAGKENCPLASLFVSLVCLTPDLNSARRAGHGHATGSIPRPLDKNSVCGRPAGARRAGARWEGRTLLCR